MVFAANSSENPLSSAAGLNFLARAAASMATQAYGAGEFVFNGFQRAFDKADKFRRKNNTIEGGVYAAARVSECEIRLANSRILEDQAQQRLQKAKAHTWLAWALLAMSCSCFFTAALALSGGAIVPMFIAVLFLGVSIFSAPPFCHYLWNCWQVKIAAERAWQESVDARNLAVEELQQARLAEQQEMARRSAHTAAAPQPPPPSPRSPPAGGSGDRAPPPPNN